MSETQAIRLVLADVDGTLVTNDKVLTNRAKEAVVRLNNAQILFSLTSGRPPRGMEMFIEPLNIKLPFAAFNGGQLVSPTFDILVEHVLDDQVVEEIADRLGKAKLDIWFYAGSDWYVPHLDGSHVDRESATVRFEPKSIQGSRIPSGSIVKIVGVSDNHQLINEITHEVREAFGEKVTAEASQPYYLDITHPLANKGAVVTYLAECYGLAKDQIATIGDMPNDVEMFMNSGLAIAMGNAEPEVQEAANQVTTSNLEEGFAIAMERFVLGAKASDEQPQ